MSRETTGEILDFVLKSVLTGGVLTLGILVPNAVQALQKPLSRQMDRLDKKGREREIRRVIYYMKSQGLLAGDYDHGLIITKSGRQRLDKLDFDNLKLPRLEQWDRTWRIVFYDIPEEHGQARHNLVAKLRRLNFFQLQRSVFIHPFPCREAIEKVTVAYGVEKYVSYVETPHLDNEQVLIKRFQKHYLKTRF